MKYIAKSFFGLEELLAAELNEAGAQNIDVRNRAVIFEGDKEVLYSANYSSRTALSILSEIASFRMKKADDLYDMALNIEWDSFMSVDDTFSVISVAYSPLFKHSAYPGLVVKDAVADFFRRRTGRRPSVNTAHPRIVINLHISENDVTISLDSSVLPLFKRGYRKNQGPAPLNESLAAGMIMLTGWKGDTSFHDPMCGSGTIAIEAGLIAASVPPGSFRDFFGFQNWKSYDPDLFEVVKKKFNNRIKTITSMISGSDISHQSVKYARENVGNAGLSGEVRIIREDFMANDSPKREGLLIFNPPYGKRIDPGELTAFYSSIGTVLKHKHAGCQAWIFSGAPEYLKAVALRPSSKIKLFNGSIECQFNRYELQEGSYSSPKKIQ